jgi:hypothetical protein
VNRAQHIETYRAFTADELKEQALAMQAYESLQFARTMRNLKRDVPLFRRIGDKLGN